MTELVTFGETSLRLRPRGEDRFETATGVHMEASGVESNVAVAASQLGADAVWLSKLPDTPLGHRVERELHQHGVETAVAWAGDGDGTEGEGERERVRGRGRGRQSLQFFEPGADPREGRHIEDRAGCAVETVTPGELPMERVQAADGVFVAGSTVALSDRLAETAGAVLRAGGGDGIVAMDLDYREGLWSLSDARDAYEDLFPAVDVLFANEGTIETVFERSGNPREVAHSIASKGGFEMVVITRSKRGALAWHDSVIHEQDSVETEVVDPSGQHGAFTGAFLERVLDGASTDEALVYGVASAALARTVAGPMTTIGSGEVETLAADLGRGR